MSAEPTLVFLNSKTLGMAGGVERFVQAFQHCRYDVRKLRVGSTGKPIAGTERWDDQTEWIVRQAYEHRMLDFEASRLADAQRQIRFEVFVQLGWGEEHLGEEERAWVGATCFQTALFNRSEHDTEYYSQFFLDLGRELYAVLRPAFGWLGFCQLSGHTGFDDVEQLGVPHVYWANYFGPDYVSKLGREHLMSAPTWSTEPLVDGGILYVLGSSPGVVCEDHVAKADVQRHFGVESVR